jgi:hypothetical protein
MHDEMIEEFQDVLQNIEYAIMGAYGVEPDLLDLDVIDALDVLIRRYVLEEQGRTPPTPRLADRARRVFDAAEAVCEMRLGRAALSEDSPDAMLPPELLHSVADIILCLKRIRKSVNFWNNQAGRQGYLDYVSSFMP